MLKEKVENKPVRLYKKEVLALEYEKGTVYLTGALFIMALVVLSFIIGTDNSTFLFMNAI